jgi:ABC-type Fe3+-hydroxamate transport system substrate-binding protein
VSLVPSATEILFAIGAGDLVVARSAWCDQPPEVAALPVAGDALTVDVEAVFGLSPDLVLIAGGNQRAALAPLAERLRVEVVAPETVAEVRAAIADLARWADREAAGGRLVADIDAALAAVRERQRGRSPRRVLFVVQRDPVVAAGDGCCVGELLAALNLSNAAGGLARPWPEVPLETLVARDPEIIVDAAVNAAGEPRTHWARFPTLSAVRGGRVVAFPEASLVRPGPRLPLLLAALERALGEGER